MDLQVDPNRYYVVTINNHSTTPSSFAIFPDTFEVTPSPHEPITATVLASFLDVPPGSVVSVSIPRDDMRAVCGKMSEAAGTAGLEAQVLSSRSVSLGAMREEGVPPVFGTALGVEFAGGSPRFVADGPPRLARAAGPGAFAIQTSDDYTLEEAKGVGFVIGVGLTQPLIETIGPSVKFCPSPNEGYVIKPNSVFYVICGKFDTGTSVTEDMKAVDTTAICKVEFSQARNLVIITQNAKRQLVIHKFARTFNL